MKLKGMAVLAAALAASTALAAPASAATITYTVSGNFNGVLNGQGFDTAAVFTGIGDTDDRFSVSPGITVVPLSQLSALAGGVTYNVLGATEFFINRGESLGGFTIAGGYNFVATLNTAVFELYDGVSNLSPTLGTVAAAPFSFATDMGAVQINGATNLTVSAVNFAAAVPEPATWAMMLVGFGGIGFAMRRRKAKVTTIVAYA